MNEHREPSHPVSVPGRSPGGESPMEALMQAVGEAIQGSPCHRGTLSPGVDDKYGQSKRKRLTFEYKNHVADREFHAPPYSFAFKQ